MPPPKRKPPQAPPKEGMSLSPLTYIWLFQIVCNKDIPSFGGAWGGFLLGAAFFFTTGAFKIDLGYQSFCNKTIDYINCEINVFQN